MLCIQSPSPDIYFNLAAEEYLLKQTTENVFMLWQDEASVVMGKHQRMEAEVDPDFARERGIPIARRFSGGGTVYHDLGNINLTFIETTRLADFNRYLERSIGLLASAGVTAVGDERLGMYVNGLKVSGSAQCVHKNRVMYHCTLLYDTDLDVLNRVLDARPLPDTGRQVYSVPSVRSEVTNIKKYLPSALTTEQFRDFAFRYFMQEAEDYRFTPDDYRAIGQLRDEKYACWDWISGLKR